MLTGNIEYLYSALMDLSNGIDGVPEHSFGDQLSEAVEEGDLTPMILYLEDDCCGGLDLKMVDVRIIDESIVHNDTVDYLDSIADEL